MTTTLIILAALIVWTILALGAGMLIGKAIRRADKAEQPRRSILRPLFFDAPDDEGDDRSHLN